MFEPKIRISKDLYARLKERAEKDGYSSVEELVTHVLEKAAEAGPAAADEETVARQLRGLGYID